MFGLEPQTLLGLSVVGAVITTVGNLIANALRDYVLVRSFEQWKLRQQLISIQQKYRDPLIQSASELCFRFAEVIREHPAAYLRRQLLSTNPEALRQNSADDEYFQKYKLVSSIYRLCAFLGWIELFRQEVTFFDSGRRSASRKIEESLREIRADLAEGALNDTDDWPVWRDALVFREEQRAIGEAMIRTGVQPWSVVGYGSFCAMFEDDSTPNRRWFKCVADFLLDPEATKDFRTVRLRRLTGHLVDFIECLDPTRLSPELRKARADARRPLSTA